MPTRQELYDRIRESSRQEVILEEMIQLGFWPSGSQVPYDPKEDLRRERELQQELQQLATKDRNLQNIDYVRAQARKQRLAESRQKQKETKERRLREKQERASAWQARKVSEILYLGEGVSNSLNQRESNHEKLSSAGLPRFDGVEDLAQLMGVTVGELRFLAYDRAASQVTHYRRFGLKKKTGGIREISAPMPRLKRAQEWILKQILEKVEVHDSAHGFRPGRSILTNARPHVGQDVVINLDLENFFPTVTFPRIRGVFRSLGYSGQLATLLALICSEPEKSEVILDGQHYHVARSERRLPQGAPSSPALTNIICRGLDARLAALASRLEMTYTRYADDITFSGSGEATQTIGKVLRQARYIIASEDFRIHPSKTRILRKGSRQEVTGLIVNEQLGVNRELLRRFRALLYQIEVSGPAGKHWGGKHDVMTSITGFANFVQMVDPDKGRPLQEKVASLQKKHGIGQRRYASRTPWNPSTVAPDQPSKPGGEEVAYPDSGPRDRFRNGTPEPKKPWWKFW
ncbi:MAG: hypothetical protein KDA80_04185 [Planctomycetaceae bacterium]|nr:hypothetical protein [Planctomycetaceae bacterium]